MKARVGTCVSTLFLRQDVAVRRPLPGAAAAVCITTLDFFSTVHLNTTSSLLFGKKGL